MLKNATIKSGVIFVTLLLMTNGIWANEPAHPEIPVAGVMGLRGQTDEGWIAVRVDIAMNCAMAGFLWYNNDCEGAFPRVLLGTGFPDGPGNVENAMVVAENVAGASSGWSEAAFSEPVAAALGSLYLIFEIPEGVAYERPGTGGGPAVGYFAAQTGARGWISGDGQEWGAFGAGYSFAIAPVLVPYVDGMAIKSLNGQEIQPQIAEPYLLAGPNPFNPRTEIRFGLPQAAHVRLEIYDLRGRRVVQLVDGAFPAGDHVATWLGCDGQGRGMASGVYFARLNLGGEELTRKLMLVR